MMNLAETSKCGAVQGLENALLPGFCREVRGSHTILLLLCKTCKTYIFVGGAEGIRTPDLRRAKAALSQLSYGPRRAWRSEFTAVAPRGLTRFEFAGQAVLLTRGRPLHDESG